MRDTLFPLEPARRALESPHVAGTPRLEYAIRDQMELHLSDLDSLVEESHTVRAIWDYVERADLAELYAEIRATEGAVGRPAIDPKILLALWMYATVEGVGSARALDRLCAAHVAYRWICGGVPVNYHTLADFRSGNVALLDRLLAEHLAVLRAAGLVTLKRVAHDGLRVRASAGQGSFRREETLRRYREEAAAQVAALRQELEEDPAACDKRCKAARERAARERQARIEAALREYPEVRAHKKKDKAQARVSTTDPEARVMRMPDGGFRPAYNVQLSVETATQIIVGAGVSQSGSDSGQLLPAVERLEERQACRPDELLADGGFADRDDIQKLECGEPRCVVYVPPPEFKQADGTPLKPSAHEPAAVQAWRERMQTSAAKALYKERAASVECANAQMRNRGMQQFRVRGLNKVWAVTCLFALVHNVLREVTLRREVGLCPSG